MITISAITLIQLAGILSVINLGWAGVKLYFFKNKKKNLQPFLVEAAERTVWQIFALAILYFSQI